MIKKYFLLSLLVPAVLISLLIAMPYPVHASWFGAKSLAATVNSFFSKIGSLVVGNQTPKKAASSPIQANCIPPVPPKPANTDVGSKRGSIIVTPEAATVGDIVTMSVTPNLDIIHNLSINVPTRISKNDLIDWSPKQQPGIIFNQQTFDSSEGYSKVPNSAYGWGVGRDQKTLPITQTYWVKVRLRNATIPERAKNTIVNSPGWNENHGWKQILYNVSNPSTTDSRGFHGIYIGREQKPSLITTIPNYDPKYQTFAGHFLKPFVVAPNYYFEIQTKSLEQPGTITMDIKYGKILGAAKRQVKADETTIWKIQPLRVGPVLLRELSLVNTCGEDYFVDPAQTARLSELDQFKFPVVYDFEALTTQSVDLALGIRGLNLSLISGSDELVHLKAELSTKGDTKIPVPSVPITFRAVYKDSPNEIVKNAVFKTYDSEKENAGEITSNTIKYGESVTMGSALVRVTGKKLTAKDAVRGIMIKATSNRFPGLLSETTMPVVVAERKSPEEETAVKGLLIATSRSLTGLKEGDKITFTARLLMSDDSTKIVKDGVKWTVAGKIGSISATGVFEAKLDESIAEFGEGVGAVAATYKDAKGTSFTAASPIFKVEAFVPAGGGEG